MDLFRQHNQFWVWTARILRQFLRVRPGATLLVIASTGLADIARLLAIFIPLKAILLAGSPGVPRYFPFIDPDEKMAWVVGFAVGAFAAYSLTLLLDAIAARWSRDAGLEILEGANQMSLHARQDDEAQQVFADFSGIIAAGLFIAVGALLLAWINPALILFFTLAVLALFGFTAWALRTSALPPPPLKAWITQRTGQYLAILYSLTFLGGFLVILAPFVLGGGGNILIALLGIILSRQMLSHLSSMAKDAVSLQQKRERIDPLVFRSIHLRSDQQTPIAVTLQAVFAKDRRQRRSREELVRAAPLQGELAVYWSDSTLSRVKTLTLIEQDSQGQPLRHFQQQIFPPRQTDQLDNEAFLFGHVTRKRLSAPELLVSFEEADFRCQICTYGVGEPVSEKEWPEIRDGLLHQVWSYVPTKAMVRSYKRSRPLLPERLNPALSRRLAVATDTPEEAELLARWQADLPSIQEQLKMQPLALHNPDLNRANVVRAGEDHLIVAWGRWVLEPLGAAMFLSGASRHGAKHLEILRPLRADLRDRAWDGELRLAALCQQLEQQISRENYKAALGIIKTIQTHRVAANKSGVSVRAAS